MTFYGFPSGEPLDPDEPDVEAHQAEDRERILNIARFRSSTPGVAPLKRVCVDVKIMGEWEALEDLHKTSFAERLRNYVQIIDWTEM